MWQFFERQRETGASGNFGAAFFRRGAQFRFWDGFVFGHAELSVQRARFLDCLADEFLGWHFVSSLSISGDVHRVRRVHRYLFCITYITIVIHFRYVWRRVFW